jgi:3-oxoacyl-[acyl-carrier-protein] synthase II
MLVAAHRAVVAARLAGGPRCGLVCGTGFGALDEAVAFLVQVARAGMLAASPSLFPSSVISAAAGQVSMHLGLSGYNATICHGDVSGELAVINAAEALVAARAEAVVAGGVDEASPAVGAGLARLGLLAAASPRPYGAPATGAVLGEGACALALERAEDARARGAPALARIVGYAAGSDAGVVARCLAMAGLAPADVQLVIGSGCGAVLGDAAEVDALLRAFGGEPPPITSAHGALGWHPAAGVLRVALAVGVLRREEVFPTLTTDPDPRLGAALVTGASRRMAVERVLVYGHALAAVGGAAPSAEASLATALLVVRG